MAEKEPHARVFHVEDDERIRRIVSGQMQANGHEVVLSAGTVREAKSYIPDELIARAVNMAIIDGSLPDGSGETVANAIRIADLPMPIISFSGGRLLWGNINLDKANGPKPLLEAVSRTISKRNAS